MTQEQFQKATQLNNKIEQLTFLKLYFQSVCSGDPLIIRLTAKSQGYEVSQGFTMEMPSKGSTDLISDEINLLIQHFEQRIVALNDSLKEI